MDGSDETTDVSHSDRTAVVASGPSAGARHPPSSGQAAPIQEPLGALPLSGETVALTGTLASMRHREAAEQIEKAGGRFTAHVSRATTMLVIGEEGWPLEEDGAASLKLNYAMELAAGGSPLRIVAETDWLHLLGLHEQRDEIRRAYTPAMLSKLLDVPVRLIRRWSRLGLIRPVKRVCRLPYFDFREVTSARRLAGLIESGVTPETLEASLGRLQTVLQDSGRSLDQLNLLVRDDRILIRDHHGILNPRTGQRLLDFEAGEAAAVPTLRVHRPGSADSESVREVVREERFSQGQTASVPSDDSTRTAELAEIPETLSFEAAQDRRDFRRMGDWNADEWFHEGCRLAEEGALEAAVNTFRNALTLVSSYEEGDAPRPELRAESQQPDSADINFHLADALYRMNRPEAAIERYYCAIERAPDFVEAWSQLGCIALELGRVEQAEDAFGTALSIFPSNAEVLLHLAQLYDSQNRGQEALTLWEQFLRLDHRGPWAEHAAERVASLRSDQPNSESFGAAETPPLFLCDTPSD